MSNKKKTSFTLSTTALDILKKLADQRGISMASMMEMLIREADK